MSKPSIAFIDLSKQQEHPDIDIQGAIQKVLTHGKYIMGPEVKSLETALCDFTGAKYAITCSSGTDSLLMFLMAHNIGPGDAVFVPSFTFASTAEMVALLGATPVFIDIQKEDFNLSPTSLEDGIAVAKAQNLTPRAIIPVDLFGQPAHYQDILSIANTHHLLVLCDAAQSFGATYKEQSIGTIGHATSTSFFPAKPLGCYGDGGCVFTDNDDLYTALNSIRVHGKGSEKYDNIRIGLNARLDTIQAAILLEKLRIYPEEIQARNAVAKRYNDAFAKHEIVAPQIIEGRSSVWAQYTLILPTEEKRDALQVHAKHHHIPTAIYYPRPLHQQTAYTSFPKASDTLPVSETLSKTVLSLPIHPYMDVSTQKYIIDHIAEGL